MTAGDGVDTMWFLPSALNVKVKEFNQARVNGGSNYDSLKLEWFLATLREIVGCWRKQPTLCLLVHWRNKLRVLQGNTTWFGETLTVKACRCQCKAVRWSRAIPRRAGLERSWPSRRNARKGVGGVTDSAWGTCYSLAKARAVLESP